MSDTKTERRFTGMLLDMIRDISNALSISEEDQACANGAVEIIIAIEWLKSAAARLAVERAEFRREVESLTAERDLLAAELAELTEAMQHPSYAEENRLRAELAELRAVRDRYCAALCELATLGNEPLIGNSLGNRIAADALAGATTVPAAVPDALVGTLLKFNAWRKGAIDEWNGETSGPDPQEITKAIDAACALLSATPVPAAVADADLERIIDESDARWTEDMFHVHGGELMDMLRKAAAQKKEGE